MPKYLIDILEFLYQRKEYFISFLACIIYLLLLKALYIHRKQFHENIIRCKLKLSFALKKAKATFISISYKIKAKIKSIILKIKRFFVSTKSRIFFFLFYIPYISFFVYLVVVGKMQEADVAFKYIVFPLYFAIPILFKNAFDRLEALSEKLEEQTYSSKSKTNRSARFSSNDEVKSITKKVDISQVNYPYSGIPLIFDGGKNAYIEDSESHSLIIGSTGCGKTRRFVLPLINIVIRAGESFIATDPKGELYSSTKKSLEERGYKIVVLNFRNPSRGNSWNPLLLPYQYYIAGDRDKAVELLNDLGLNIIYTKQSSADPFWENSAVDYFIGLALALFEDADNQTQINFNSIYNMSRMGERKIGKQTTIQSYYDLKDENDLAAMSASGTIHAPNDTRASILSVFHQKIRLFNSNAGLSRMLSDSDFDIRNFSEQKTALFLIIHDEKSVYHPLASAFLKQCYEVLVDTANKLEKKKLKLRMNFILDEFANLPPIIDMDNIITASRSRNIRMYLVVQGMKQLNSVYGDNVADIIKGNCDYWYYMMSKELALLREISELCGTKQSDEEVLISNSVPLISVSELQRLNIGEVLVMQKRLPPYLANFSDIEKYTFFELDEAEEPAVKVKREPDIFSIRKFVGIHIYAKFLDEGKFSEEDIKRFEESGGNIEVLIGLINNRIAELEAIEKAEREKRAEQKKQTEDKSVEQDEKKSSK